MIKAEHKPKTKFQRNVTLTSMHAKRFELVKECISMALACLQYTEAADTTFYEVLIQ